MITFFKVLLVLAFLIIPLSGRAKRNSRNARHIQQTYTLSRYAINRQGKLKEINNESAEEESED